MHGRQFVFGYGSLVDDSGIPARLREMARGWGVAMDNRVDLPGYKHYLDAEGHRPAVHVCFLDVDQAADAAVRGRCRPVDAAQLAVLDARERNYDRVDVSDRIEVTGGLDGRVWTYVGSTAGRARFAAARAAGTAVIDATYLAAVTSGLRALGRAAWAESAPSLDPGGLPVVELILHPVA